MTYDLIRGHGRTDVFLNFAGVTGDFERIIEHWVSEEEWVKAIDVLHRQVGRPCHQKHVVFTRP
jgi:hypothetical protein